MRLTHGHNPVSCDGHDLYLLLKIRDVQLRNGFYSPAPATQKCRNFVEKYLYRVFEYNCPGTGGKISVTLAQLKTLFWSFGFGIGLSFVVLACELAFSRKSHRTTVDSNIQIPPVNLEGKLFRKR